MSDLRFDGNSLREAATRIRQVVDSFATAGVDARAAAAYVGHVDVARRVREFADGWDVRRAKISDELGQIADTLDAIDDTFTDVDNHAAATLREAGTMMVAPSNARGDSALSDPRVSLAARARA